MKKATIIKLLLLFFTNIIYAQWTQIGTDVHGVSNSDFGRYVSLSSDGNVMAIGKDRTSTGVVVYENISGNWVQKGSLIFGEEVSLNHDGSILAVSLNVNSTSRGVKVYQYVSSDWQEIGSVTRSSSGFASSLRISADGNMVIIGDENFSVIEDNAGAVYFFKNNSGNWDISDQIYGQVEDGYFGKDVSINYDGTVAIVGESNISYQTSYSHEGAVKVYKYESNIWSQEGSTLYGERANDFFGSSVDISDDGQTIIASSPNYDIYGYNAGQVKVFNNISGQWVLIHNKLHGNSDREVFGNRVAISGDASHIIVGSLKNIGLEQAGEAMVYENTGTYWAQVGSSFMGVPLELRGSAVDISNDGIIIAIGAKDNNDNGTSSGITEVYTYSCDAINSLNLGNDTIICENTNLVLDAGSGAEFTWNTGDSLQFLSVDSGTFIVNVSAFSCSNSDTIYVNTQQAPIADLPDTIYKCTESSIVLDAGVADNYYWNTGSASQTITCNTEGNYSIYLSLNNNCFDTDSCLIVDYIVNTDLEDSMFVCTNTDVQITANSDNNNIWNSIINADTINYFATNDTTIYLDVTDTNACVASDSVTVVLKTTTFNYSYSGTSYTFNAVGDTNQIYSWNFGDDSTATGQTVTHTFQDTGVYQVCLFTSNGCTDTICENIDINCALNLFDNLPVDTFIYPNQDYVYQINDVYETYVWYNGSNTNEISLSNSILNTSNDIYVTLYSDSACYFEHNYNLEVFECQEFNLFIDTSGLEFENNMIEMCIHDNLILAVDSIDFYQNNTNYTQTIQQLQYSWAFSNSPDTVWSNSIVYTANLQGFNAIQCYATDQYGCESVLNSTSQVNTLVLNNIFIYSSSISTDTLEITDTLFLNGIINLLGDTTLNYTKELYNAAITDDSVMATYELPVELNSIITDASQIKDICAKLSHTFANDLQISVECPNGQSIILETAYGAINGTDLGGSGQAYDYCWNMQASETWNQAGVNYDNSESLPAGSYLPDEAFNGLVGCPTSGNWKFNIIDKYIGDYGEINNWSIEFDSTLIDKTDSFQIYWSGENILDSTLVEAVAVPDTFGTFDYTFTVINNRGCLYSVTKPVVVIPYSCQEFSLDIDVNGLNLIGNTVNTCKNEITSFNISSVNFYQNNTHYTQTEQELEYFWNFNDGSALNVGDNISHIFTNSGYYNLQVYAIDDYGCYSNSNSYINVYVPNDVPLSESAIINDTIVLGDSIQLVGIIGDFLTDVELISVDSFSIPDGTGVEYISVLPVEILGVYDSETNIEVFVNIHHTYAADLLITLESPEGYFVTLHNDHSSIEGTNLGVGNECWTYTWSMQGTETWNTAGSALSNVSLPSGVYLPEESFDNFLGTNLTGYWILHITDTWAADEGFMCSWGINLHSVANQSSSFNVLWTGDNITNPTSDTTFATPNNLGLQQYTFTVENSVGCTYDTTLYVYVDQSTGFETISNNGLKIYPNPVKNKLIIESDNEIKTVEIIDVTGKKQFGNLLINNLNTCEIDVSNLKNGIYFIKVNNNSFRKFIKQ